MNELIENPINGRFKDAPWINSDVNITVGGVGGIGSWLTILLTRLGDNRIKLFDDDHIEVQNIGGQFYPTQDIGSSKLSSIYDTVYKYSGFDNLELYNEKFSTNSIPTDVMFSAFDNMKARKEMSELWYNHQIVKQQDGTYNKEEINVFIDGRLEAEQGIIYCINSKTDYKRYVEELFDDTEIENGPCTFRVTSHCAAIIAGYMVTAFTNVVTNKRLGGNFREVPYKITYELPTFTFNIER